MTYVHLFILHKKAKGLLAIQWIIFYLLKGTLNHQLKVLASAVKQAVCFQSNAVIKTSARGHSKHDETVSPIVTEM